MTYLERVNGCWTWVVDTYEHWQRLPHIAGAIGVLCGQTAPCHSERPSRLYNPPGYEQPFCPAGQDCREPVVWNPSPITVHYQPRPTNAPEPAGVLVLGLGVGGIWLVRRRR